MTRRSWTQIDGKLIPKEEVEAYRAQKRGESAYVMPDIQPFRSTVDGSVISSRRALREHNLKHDVVQRSEFSPEYIQKKVQERQQRMMGQTAGDRRERIEILKHAIDRHRR